MTDDYSVHSPRVWRQVEEPKLEPTMSISCELLSKKPHRVVDALLVLLVSFPLGHSHTF